VGKFFLKKRQLLDADEVTLAEILQHSFVNFLSGFTGGVTLSFVALFISRPILSNAFLLFVSHSINKQVDSKILNRNRYVTKLGRNYIFPIPSTIGFVLGAYVSTEINKLL
jgi:hypothetical protein